jgi:hypothetical protein
MYPTQIKEHYSAQHICGINVSTVRGGVATREGNFYNGSLEYDNEKGLGTLTRNPTVLPGQITTSPGNLFTHAIVGSPAPLKC